jgi:hypothetical protein
VKASAGTGEGLDVTSFSGGDREKIEGSTLEKEEKNPDPERLDNNEERGLLLLLSGVESFDDEWYDVTPTRAISFTT